MLPYTKAAHHELHRGGMFFTNCCPLPLVLLGSSRKACRRQQPKRPKGGKKVRQAHVTPLGRVVPPFPNSRCHSARESSLSPGLRRIWGWKEKSVRAPLHGLVRTEKLESMFVLSLAPSPRLPASRPAQFLPRLLEQRVFRAKEMMCSFPQRHDLGCLAQPPRTV